MKNLTLVFFSTLVGIVVVYLILFLYTFFNLNKEFVNTFKSVKEFNFHKKYSQKLHHVRDSSTIKDSFKVVETEDLLFTEINKDGKADLVVLFQGDSWMEQMVYPAEPNFISVNFVIDSKFSKKVRFINAGTTSYSPSLMNLQLNVLVEDFDLRPDIVITYIDQTDIGDENCRYKNKKIYKDKTLIKVEPENYSDHRNIFNYAKVYGISNISLSKKTDFVKTFELINFKAEYSWVRFVERFKKKYIAKRISDTKKSVKCYLPEMEKYLISPKESEIKYFENSILEYLNNINQKKYIRKLYFVSFPHKKHFQKSYNYNVSDSIDNIIKNHKSITHINFSKKFLNNEKFQYENIWYDNIHLNFINYKNLFLKNILEELKIYIN